MSGTKFKDDLPGKTESIPASVWRIRWVIAFFCVILSGVYLYADYLSTTNGQPEIKSASFDHKINFKYLGADTGKYSMEFFLFLRRDSAGEGRYFPMNRKPIIWSA